VRAIDPENPIDDAGESERLTRLDEWYARAVTFHSPTRSTFVEATNRAINDIGSFALLEGPRDEWLVPGAGLPLYQTVWGRDSLTTAWQAGLFDGGAMLSDVLAFLGRRQGRVLDAERDEEPGRIINQAKSDPLSRIGQSPFGRYYADFASPFMYIIGMGFHYVLTGSREALESHWATANGILQWAEEYADRDGDGYLEYLTQSPRGPTHQGWKDSENAIVDEYGRTVQPPIAPCEIQGYWYAALVYMTALSVVLGERERARALWQQARELKQRFNRDFWMEDEGFIALGLDASKKPIRTITSNPGHCLPCGIISAEHIPGVVRRLSASDLFRGWGIRTLSANNPAYQPLDYHLGSVWPVENATILFGLRRYGFNERAHELAHALHDLALLWPGGTIPECIGGYARTESGHPGAYPRANRPQTWNQSALPLALQCLLGLVPVAPLRLLMVDPILPPWLPDLTVGRIPVGDATVTIRFARDARGRSRFRILEKTGTVRVIRQPWIESFDARWLDRIVALRQTVFA
jgi:glycogen debranching enzyme